MWEAAKSGHSPFPAKVNSPPAATLSLTVGSALAFTASAQTAHGANINTPITFTSSDTSILTLAPNGVACAGHWDVAFTACTPGTGVVTGDRLRPRRQQRPDLCFRASAHRQHYGQRNCPRTASPSRSLVSPKVKR